MSALDGRAPFVLDIRELHRRAGAMMTFQLTEPAPVDLANAMIAVPPGSELRLEVMAESVIEGVLITGKAQARAAGSCSRCLEPMSEPIEVEFRELFRYPDSDGYVDEGDQESPMLEGELIDIEPTLRDAVVLELPLAPVCGPECPGLCPDCGVRLAEQPGHHHDQTDPRWAALTGVFGEQSLGDDRDTGVKG